MSPHDEAPDLPSSDNLAPIGVNREQAAAYVGISAGLFDRLVHHGLMPDARMVYGRLIWNVQEVTVAFRDLLHRTEHVDRSTGDGQSSWD